MIILNTVQSTEQQSSGHRKNHFVISISAFHLTAFSKVVLSSTVLNIPITHASWEFGELQSQQYLVDARLGKTVCSNKRL